MKKNNHYITHHTSHITHSSSGFSQVEIIVTILVISIVVVGVIAAFSSISKGLITSKTRTIANNLVQEKIEFLKDFSYARLLVTPQDDLDDYGYDNTNIEYSSETLRIGGADFIRYTTVWKARESGTTISTMSPTASDEGIKKIKIEVKWTERNEVKSMVLYNFRDDPNRETKSGRVYGIISSTVGVTDGISSAKVAVLQNLNWSVTTSATGYYIIKTTTPAIIQIRASKDGYWSKTSGNIDVSVNQDLELTQKLTGTVTGYVVITDHLVISQVVASTQPAGAGGEQEWVELYNPTTWAWTISDATIDLYYIDDANSEIEFTLTFISNEIPSYGYYLIANTGTVINKGVSTVADATYSEDVPIVNDTAGGIVLSAATGIDDKIDAVAWSRTSAPVKTAPARATEGTGYAIGNGLEANKCLIRLSLGEAALAAGKSSYGSSFDSNNNAKDFKLYSVGEGNFTVTYNTTTTKPPVCGTPALGAIVSANDGLSSFTTAYAVAAHNAAYFSITVATGICTVYISSGNYFREIANVEVFTGVGTAITNSSTSPQWPASDRNKVILSSPSAGGFISGQVIDAASDGVSGIRVEAGIESVTTDTAGNYSFSVEEGSYTVTANPDYFDKSWTQDSETVEVNEGETVFIDGGDTLTIYPAGWVSGTTYNASGGLLPYITIMATVPLSSPSFSKDTVSATDGTYIIKGVRSGYECYLEPILDEADSVSSPASGNYTFTLTQGNEESGQDFTISSAWGKITGSVRDGGNNITTGVLIIATTAGVPADDPPTISGGTVGGSDTIYYGAISISGGTYEIKVRKGWGYHMKAWYTKTSGNAVVTTSAIPDEGNPITVNASNPIKTGTFSWP